MRVLVRRRNFCFDLLHFAEEFFDFLWQIAKAIVLARSIFLYFISFRVSQMDFTFLRNMIQETRINDKSSLLFAVFSLDFVKSG
jgi:hypothetical protein